MQSDLFRMQLVMFPNSRKEFFDGILLLGTNLEVLGVVRLYE